jgi:hypothetical protein
MSREEFRRELGDAIDSISGSPSPALPDRVRSALTEAPERRGPMWAVGLAAALIAAVVVGVLIVSNPLNRQGPGPVGHPSPTPSPSASQTPATTPSPTATPSGSLPAFECGIVTTIPGQSAPPVAFIDSVRTGTHAGYDRLTIGFNNGQPVSIDVHPQSGTTFTQGASGQQVVLLGQSGILVIIHGADAHTSYSGQTDFKTGYPVLVEVRQVEDFEGTVQWALGLSKSACYRAFILPNPTRLVIDIQTS